MTYDSRETQENINKLIKDYSHYKELLHEQQVVATRLAKQKLHGNASAEDEERHKDLTKQLQELSDAMTFASPTIWIGYKAEAYKSEAQPIRTMHDFRMHCSKPDYICTKRFIFVNQQLAIRNLPTLKDDAVYADDKLLSELLADNTLAELEQDDEFMRQWAEHEYFQTDGRVAKWENFQPVS